MNRNSTSAPTIRRTRRSLHRRRGAIWVMVLAMIVVLLGMTALSVDVAYIHLTRTQLRAATDAAARAGGESLSRLQSVDAARDAAKTIAARNKVANDPLLLADSDIIFGNSAQTANGTWSFNPGAMPTNAMQVSGKRTAGSLGGSVGLFFGRIFNVNQFEPSATAAVVKVDRDICIVLDRSSSMKLDLTTTAQTMNTSDPRFKREPDPTDSRWAAAAAATSAFVDELNKTPQKEQVALVSFGSDCTYFGVHNTESSIDQALTYDPNKIDTAVAVISNRKFNGSTNTAAGIDRGVVGLTDPTLSRPFARKIMVYLTDGFRTQGRNPVAAARDAATKDIVIYTITFGATFDHSEMVAVASATGGRHYHAPDADSLTQIFREIAASTNVILTQ